MRSILLGTVVVFVCTLASCSARSTKVVAPDGEAAFALRCSSTSSCYEEAGEACPYGYERLDEDKDRVSRSGLMNSTTATRTDWLIRCRPRMDWESGE